ncbi:MAG: HAD hydrolase-like protein [Thaumarchaeota archaeon]|nr:HAD hydrolase-like protein [Candidatus Calditenuaceae archaeon]MDW8041920.1 HAD hydrolase-like protein [Nitrososphaerota archaeon]
MRGVLFDLFGTLVPRYPIDRHRESLKKMSQALNVDWSKFAEVWISKLDERIRGSCRDTTECIGSVLADMGATADEVRLAEATRIRLDFVRSCVIPFDDVGWCLRELKSMGFKLGLLSNSSPEVPVIWRSVEVSRLLDASVFSCEVGVAKPDPRVYRIASRVMDVEPRKIVFVSDGPQEELEEATRVGMRSIMIARDGAIGDWRGEVVIDLRELVKKLKQEEK